MWHPAEGLCGAVEMEVGRWGRWKGDWPHSKASQKEKSGYKGRVE